MRRANEPPRGRALRIVIVGTGTDVGKTFVACALLSQWSERGQVAGLKPIVTGVDPRLQRRTRSLRARGAEASGSTAPDQERLTGAAGVFHVKRHQGDRRRGAAQMPLLRSLYAFPDPISPHLAARRAGVRIDLGLIDRWVRDHEAPMTVIETAGGLFSPLGHGATNFELTQALQPQAVVLVAPDRLGVLHELTTTLALAAARGGPPLGVVLSTPAKKDASTGCNAAELSALGITQPLAVFPRASARASVTAEAARRIIAWIENDGG